MSLYNQSQKICPHPNGNGNYCYHLHINVFNISGETPSLLKDLGFFEDPFEAKVSSYVPPLHFTLETSNLSKRRLSWEKALQILKKDIEFKGYIESESLTSKYSLHYKSSKLKKTNSIPFPVNSLQTIDVPFNKHKSADLHVKRGKEMDRDFIDENLLKSGFYEVHTPRNRIFTLQTESTTDAKEIFYKLKDYFDKVGGVKQVNFEVVGELVRFPPDFKVARYLPTQK